MGSTSSQAKDTGSTGSEELAQRNYRQNVVTLHLLCTSNQIHHDVGHGVDTGANQDTKSAGVAEFAEKPGRGAVSTGP